MHKAKMAPTYTTIHNITMQRNLYPDVEINIAYVSLQVKLMVHYDIQISLKICLGHSLQDHSPK